LPDLTEHQVKRPLYALPLTDNVAGILLGWEEQSGRAAGTSIDELSHLWWQRWVQPRAPELIERAGSETDLVSHLRVVAAQVDGIEVRWSQAADRVPG
jgi:hypothetical protein